MQAVSKGLEKVEQELTASENDGAISAGFQKALKNFLDTAEAEVRSLISLYSEVGRSADSLSQYFGEDPARCPFEQGLVLFMYLIFCCCQVGKFTTFLLICHKDYVRDVSVCRFRLDDGSENANIVHCISLANLVRAKFH
ncbi:formin-like protein 3 [Camellia sinensis]|uniref:formin-like protein 3 n=1 Tax=Camellia sinensis TaxID=4442 RepID=UPI0010357495|nr:formin-like protein 3 [Camellia sinensis]